MVMKRTVEKSPRFWLGEPGTFRISSACLIFLPGVLLLGKSGERRAPPQDLAVESQRTGLHEAERRLPYGLFRLCVVPENTSPDIPGDALCPLRHHLKRCPSHWREEMASQILPSSGRSLIVLDVPSDVHEQSLNAQSLGRLSDTGQNLHLLRGFNNLTERRNHPASHFNSHDTLEKGRTCTGRLLVKRDTTDAAKQARNYEKITPMLLCTSVRFLPS